MDNDEDTEEGADDGDGDGDDEGLGAGVLLLDMVGVGGEQEISSLIVGIGVAATCCL